ncbi:tRNA isopentenyltransferase [Corchorus capsularis]|uniref:tRNA isopentenyltransferase n=1 Tax=Corchorus capsularis TaxID=210143 RepID=A0A1R3GAG0_COCAP|nr:tRNA isopentenyltransferase [Corchorus capsularis]
MHRIDATEVFLKRGEDEEADEAWERLVAAPSTMIVGQFLYDENRVVSASSLVPSDPTTAVMAPAAAKSHQYSSIGFPST